MALKYPTKQQDEDTKVPTRDNDLEKYRVIIEGSDKDDRTYGNKSDNHITTVQGNDTIVASTGNDYLDGGTGFDTVDYGSLREFVVVDLETQSTLKGSKGSLGRDELYSVENVIGTKYNDIISGDGHANVLSGGTGHDQLFGRYGNDELNGDWGNDILVGGQGKDILNGGSGSDTASYFDAGGSVMVDLGQGIGALGTHSATLSSASKT
jgi:Ca2+-binding RTX toxin-like protein